MDLLDSLNIREMTKQKRVLSLFVLTMLNVSIMASLRNLPLVAEYGLSMVFFFALAAIFFMLPSALVSAELATGWTKGGGVYVWVREGLGDRWGFFAIWMQWVHNMAWFPAILAFVATSIAYVFDPELALNKTYVITVILGSFWGMTILNFFGVKTSTWFSSLGVIVGTLIPGLLVIGLGATWLIEGNPIQIPISWDALTPDFSDVGNFVFLSGLFLAFAGFEVSAVHANEVKDPRKNYPRSILSAALITFFIFLLGALSISIVIPREEISLVSGLLEAFKSFFSLYHLEWVLPIMGFLLVIGAIAEVNSWIIGPTRGLLETSRHGNLPPILQKQNKRGMPKNLLIFQALIVTAISLALLYMPNISSAYWIFTAMSAQTYLVMYIVLFITAIRLRYSHAHVPRVYEIPLKYRHRGMWLVASTGLIASVAAIIISFIPPSQLNVGSTLFYETFLIGGFLIMCAIPLIIYAVRKPEWFRERER